jgi:hypothetical protein
VKITDLNSNTIFYFYFFFLRTEHTKLIRMKKGVVDPNARTKKKKGKEEKEKEKEKDK